MTTIPGNRQLTQELREADEYRREQRLAGRAVLPCKKGATWVRNEDGTWERAEEEQSEHRS